MTFKINVLENYYFYVPTHEYGRYLVVQIAQFGHQLVAHARLKRERHTFSDKVIVFTDDDLIRPDTLSEYWNHYKQQQYCKKNTFSWRTSRILN